jgi:PAS domain-containing protein
MQTGSAVRVRADRPGLQDFHHGTARTFPQDRNGMLMPLTSNRSPLPVITQHEFEGGDASRAISHMRLVDRRRNRQRSQSPMTTLKQLPASVLLRRIAVPVLAIAHDGSVLFANTGFAEMVGCEPDEVLSLRFHQIFRRVPVSESPLSVVHALSDTVVELAHKDGSVVRALMRRSALACANDQFALAVFQDLTVQFWER